MKPQASHTIEILPKLISKLFIFNDVIWISLYETEGIKPDRIAIMRHSECEKKYATRSKKPLILKNETLQIQISRDSGSWFREYCGAIAVLEGLWTQNSILIYYLSPVNHYSFAATLFLFYRSVSDCFFCFRSNSVKLYIYRLTFHLSLDIPFIIRFRLIVYWKFNLDLIETMTHPLGINS